MLTDSVIDYHAMLAALYGQCLVFPENGVGDQAVRAVALVQVEGSFLAPVHTH